MLSICSYTAMPIRHFFELITTHIHAALVQYPPKIPLKTVPLKGKCLSHAHQKIVRETFVLDLRPSQTRSLPAQLSSPSFGSLLGLLGITDGDCAQGLCTKNPMITISFLYAAIHVSKIAEEDLRFKITNGSRVSPLAKVYY